MQHAHTLSAVQGGGAQAGIGIPGLAPIRSFPEADSYTARLAGASIPHCWSIGHHISSMATTRIAFTAAICLDSNIADRTFIEATAFIITAGFGEVDLAVPADSTAADFMVAGFTVADGGER